MDKDEMKNKISLALKDPILQQGFEIICRNLAELEKENDLLKGRNEGFEQQIMGLLIKYEEVYKRFPDLKDAMNEAERVLKENAELKKQLEELPDKWCRNKDDYCPHLAKFEKENAELKEKLEIEQIARGDWFGKAVTKDEQLTKAKEIIKKLRALYFSPVVTKEDIKRQDEILNEAEQFISGVVR